MMAFLRQSKAIFVVAYKRLATQRSLAFATTVGLTLAVALVLSVPLYAEATQFRLLREQLVGEKGAADYAPLPFVYHLDSSTRNGPQWADGQPIDQYLSQEASAALGLPASQLVRRFRTDSLQLFPPPDPNDPTTKYYVTWANFGFVSEPEKNIQLLSGSSPSVADESPNAPIEVLVNQAIADKLAIQIGDEFFARRERDKIDIPVRVVGIWAPIDPKLPAWDVKSDETLLVPEETYANRLAATLPDELYNADWFLSVSGSQLQSGDVAGLLKRIDAVSTKVHELLPDVELSSSPFNALANYQKAVPSLTVLLFAFSVPILGLILVFVGLVSGLFVNQQRNEIAILRSRGATVFQVAGMTALQGLTLGAIALAAGIPLAILITHAIGRARSFLNFNTPTNLRVILTPNVLLFGILAILVVLLFQFIVPTLSAARNTIITYKQERARAVQKPWWQRAWLDLVLLIVALLGAYALYSQRTLADADKLQVPDPLRNPQLILVPSLGIFALTLFVLRFMPAFMAAFARFTSRTRSVGLLTAARYLSRTPAFYSAPLVLLIFTLSLSAYTASIAQTLDRHLTKQMYYETGADLMLREFGTTYNNPDSRTPLYTF
ncbi:MAG: FtsX-like permease family protein [Chloroflexi bacterium]|nr:FtsX-like permease family protein [Chloroflexota bacterium]